MLRLLLIYGVPMFLPTLCFNFYRRFFKPVKTKYPWVKLLTIGLVLTGISLYFFTTFDKAPPSAQYTPPKFKNGTLVPAQMDLPRK